ncbi:helix-turn-helix domain-containing protein [uncultured Parasphingorhabdus sp.]|uniref:helix-turn-helix transcriptional regulator n=1 Tax=uncultured Parasphingorhabdus sp. TaxID=2709694 RepID=UPI002AA65F49|nr:helix-turn-helix domain-containing protein [uncultured Parasphingorhabdus sp.]
MPDFILPNEASTYLGLSPSTLAIYRCTGDGPKFYKIGRFVKYTKDDLDRWVQSRHYASTSEVAA